MGQVAAPIMEAVGIGGEGMSMGNIGGIMNKALSPSSLLNAGGGGGGGGGAQQTDQSGGEMQENPQDFGVLSYYNKNSGVADMAAKGLEMTNIEENVAKFVVNKLPIPDALKGPITKFIIFANFPAWPELAREEAVQAIAHTIEGKCPLCSSYAIGAGKPGEIGVSTAFLSMSCPLCQGQGTRDAFLNTINNLQKNGINTLVNQLSSLANNLQSKINSEQQSAPQEPEQQSANPSENNSRYENIQNVFVSYLKEKGYQILYTTDIAKYLQYLTPQDKQEIAKRANVSVQQIEQICQGIGENTGYNWFQKEYIGLKTLQNLYNNPNKQLQTQGIPGQAYGPNQFGVTSNQNKNSIYGDEYEHPSSITRRIEDPVNGGIDPHQRDDESNEDWAYDMLDVNADGQSRRTPEGEDDFNSHRIVGSIDENKRKAIEKFVNTLPLIMEFFDSEESGAEDPIIKSVHDSLEEAFPSYLDNSTPDENNQILFIIRDYQNKKGDNALHLTTSVNEINEDFNKSIGTKCERCGSNLDASMSHCPQCGPIDSSGEHPQYTMQTADNLEQNHMYSKSRIGSNEQGPHTDEQQQVFSDYLHEKAEAGHYTEDQVKELENLMFEQPSNPEIVRIWSEIVKEQPLFDTDPEDAPHPPQEQQMPNQGMPPGMPPMGAPSPADMGAPPGGPAGGIMGLASIVHTDMLKAAYHYGADSIAGQCPKCDSHTTKMIKQDGTSKCHTCAHEWTDEAFQSSDGDSSNMSATAALDDISENAPGIDTVNGPILDKNRLEKEDNPFYIGDNEENPEWSTEWVKTLEEKHPEIKEMSEEERSNFFGRKPTGDLLKETNLDSFTEEMPEELEIDDSTHEWVDEDDEPLQEGQEYEIYAHDYSIPDIGRITQIKPDSVVYEIESDGGLRTTVEIDREEANLNGYRFEKSGIGSHSENHPGIEENMDSKPVPVPGESTDLSTPHREVGSSMKLSFEDEMMKNAIDWLMSLDGPETFVEFEGLGHDDYQNEILNLPLDQIKEAIQRHYIGGWNQFVRDAQDIEPRQDDHTIAKTAGKHYTPMEQRELIDEYGEARNAGKLNLENTHYAEATDDYFLFGC